MPRIRQDTIIFVGIAMLFIAVAALIDRSLGTFGPDPDYAYLLNGLNILVFKVPNFFDHPGTPVQSIIAIILAAVWLVTLPWHGMSNVQDEVLAHPQFYMECINAVFVFCIASALVFYVRSLRKATGMITPALIGVISIFPSYSVYQTFYRIIPETVLLSVTLALAGLVARVAYGSEDVRETRRLAVAIGIALGFCITAKVTAAPLLITILFLRSGRAKKAVFLACCISALIFLLPITPRLPIMARGFLHILTHKGDYGSGGAGAPSLPSLVANLHDLWAMVPEMFLCPLFYSIALLGPRKLVHHFPDNSGRVLSLCLAVICTALILVAKQPRASYLLPEAAFICLGNTTLASMLLSHVRFPIWARVFIIGLLAALAFRNEYRYTKIDAADTRSDELLLANAAQRNCLTVFYYGVNQPEFNLYFGNIFAGQKYSSHLARLYPDFVAYKTDTKEFQTFSGTLDRRAATKRFSRERCVDLMGVPWRDDFGIARSSLHLLAQSAGGVDLYALK